MRKNAIKVMYTGNPPVLFVIEGFDAKEIEEKTLRHFITKHWEGMHGEGSVTLKSKGKDYLLTINGFTTEVTWSWITSYDLNN